jgi:hypothetical protein
MRLKQTQKAIDAFREYIIKQARTNLTKSKKNVSKDLYNSINGVTKAFPNSIQVQFEMEDYGVFQDKGVSGTKKKYNTPFSYTSKRPPRKTLEEWVSKRRFQFRDEKGRFMSYKTMAFLIQRSIYEKGIKPSLFFTKPFEKAFKNLPNELVEAYGLDLEQFLQFTFKK